MLWEIASNNQGKCIRVYKGSFWFSSSECWVTMKYFPHELDRSATNNSFISFKSAWKYFQWIRKGIFYSGFKKIWKDFSNCKRRISNLISWSFPWWESVTVQCQRRSLLVLTVTNFTIKHERISLWLTLRSSLRLTSMSFKRIYVSSLLRRKLGNK